jgi:putative ABC transport system permease protein
MELRPILSAMRRNKFGALLIATQMAVTLAFLANAITLVEQRTAWSGRPSGIDEKDIFVVTTESVDHQSDSAAREAADVEALRALPGVVDAYTTNMYPMQGGGWIDTVTLTPDQKTPTAVTANYMGDEHALNTMGVKLIAGRNYTAAEIETKRPPNDPPYSGLIVSKALAEKVFPNENALGKMIIFDSDKPAPIIGIVDRLQGPMTVATGLFAPFEEYSVLAPYHLIGETNNYMVRVQPGQLNAVMKAAESKLYSLDENRILHSKSMEQVRADAYRGDHGLIVLLTCICVALLIVTAFGIIGLTSYWVAQRLGGNAAGHCALFSNRKFHDRRRRCRGGHCFRHRLEPMDGAQLRNGSHGQQPRHYRRHRHSAARPIRGTVAGVARGFHSARVGDARGMTAPGGVIPRRTR